MACPFTDFCQGAQRISQKLCELSRLEADKPFRDISRRIFGGVTYLVAETAIL
jgi:hypothetical protein